MTRKPRKPRVLTKCVANHYAMAAERIIEFSDGRGAGGLISFRETDAGLRVEIYRMDKCEVVVGENKP